MTIEAGAVEGGSSGLSGASRVMAAGSAFSSLIDADEHPSEEPRAEASADRPIPLDVDHVVGATDVGAARELDDDVAPLAAMYRAAPRQVIAAAALVVLGLLSLVLGVVVLG